MILGGRLYGPEASALKEKWTQCELKWRLWKGPGSARTRHRLARSVGRESGLIEIPERDVALP
jgi:hypothetical protein